MLHKTGFSCYSGKSEISLNKLWFFGLKKVDWFFSGVHCHGNLRYTASPLRFRVNRKLSINFLQYKLRFDTELCETSKLDLNQVRFIWNCQL